MKILTAGCSFTKYKWSCWPNFVKWFEPNNKILNLGASASSNETIARSVLNAVMQHNDIKKIYIMWSAPNRYELVLDNKPNKEGATYATYNSDLEWYQCYGGHMEQEKHKFYEKYFLNQKQNNIRLLEKILMVQLFLEKKQIEYKMMCFMESIIEHDKNKMSPGQKKLYDQIDWNKFIFYNITKGLKEFAEENYPNEFFKPGDLHPLPLAHYKWVKDIMYRSSLEPPEHELKKLINFKKEYARH